MSKTTQLRGAACPRRRVVARARMAAGIVTTLALLAAVACGYDGPSLEVSALKKKLDADPDALLVVDVRPRSQFEKGHIAGALNAPLEEIDTHLVELSGAAHPVAVICTCGKRSLEAVKKLNAHGLTPLLVVGGMNEWEKAGYPVER